MSNWKLPKWAVVVAAALLFLPLVADWVAPRDGARLSCLVLRASCGGETPPPHSLQFPLWGWLVGLAGNDVVALGAISSGAGLLCVWLVAAIVGAIFGAAVRGARGGSRWRWGLSATRRSNSCWRGGCFSRWRFRRSACGSGSG